MCLRVSERESVCVSVCVLPVSLPNHSSYYFRRLGVCVSVCVCVCGQKVKAKTLCSNEIYGAVRFIRPDPTTFNHPQMCSNRRPVSC